MEPKRNNGTNVKHTPHRKEYSPNNILKKPGYTPTNCGDPEYVISKLSTRDAYKRATAHIDEDRSKNCCTIETDNVVKLWKAAEIPVKLTKADRSVSVTFLCAEGLKYSKQY